MCNPTRIRERMPFDERLHVLNNVYTRLSRKEVVRDGCLSYENVYEDVDFSLIMPDVTKVDFSVENLISSGYNIQELPPQSRSAFYYNDLVEKQIKLNYNLKQNEQTK